MVYWSQMMHLHSLSSVTIRGTPIRWIFKLHTCYLKFTKTRAGHRYLSRWVINYCNVSSLNFLWLTSLTYWQIVHTKTFCSGLLAFSEWSVGQLCATDKSLLMHSVATDTGWLEAIYCVSCFHQAGLYKGGSYRHDAPLLSSSDETFIFNK